MELKPIPLRGRYKMYGNGPRSTRTGAKKSLSTIAAVVLLILFVAASGVPLFAQSEPQVTAGQSSNRSKDLPAFDVASVKQNKSGLPPSGDMPTSNFPLGPGDVYVPNGGFFSATNQPLITYILFAYKIKGNQVQSLLPKLPAWVKTERFDIRARAEGDPGKDQMRLMMQSLLADRFKLGIHTESRQMQVLAFVVSKPGKIGPRLQPHPADSVCPTTAPSPSTPGSAQTPSPSQTVAGGFPTLCNGIFGILWRSWHGNTPRADRNLAARIHCGLGEC